MKKVAIVTGASSGIGREFVNLLLKEREIDEIWAVARDKEKLNRLKKRLGARVKIYSVDLSNLDQIMEFGDMIKQKKPNIKYLVNSAGYAKFCSYYNLSVQKTLNMMDVNCNAVVAMTLLSVPYMKRGGHILNLSSQASFQPLPYQNVYSATKTFVRHYSRALNVELQDRGITVTAVCPGWMRTALYQRAIIGADKTVNNFFGMAEPAKVAAKALRDARRSRDMSVYGAYVKASHIAAKLLPQKVMMKLWMAQQNF